MEKRFIGIDEMGQYLGLTKGTLYVWVCQKKIPYTKIGRLVKFDLHKIEDWLKKNSIEPYSFY